LGGKTRWDPPVDRLVSQPMVDPFDDSQPVTTAAMM